MMPDPWATYERPSAKEGQATTSALPETNEDTFALTKGFRKGRSRSATRNVETRSMVDEVLDYYVKATGRDGTQKCEELVNMRPGELATKSGALAGACTRHATPPRQKVARVGSLQQSAELQI